MVFPPICSSAVLFSYHYTSPSIRVIRCDGTGSYQVKEYIAKAFDLERRQIEISELEREVNGMKGEVDEMKEMTRDLEARMKERVEKSIEARLEEISDDPCVWVEEMKSIYVER